MATMQINATTGYYNAPYSVAGLSPHLHAGLIVVGSLACFSIVVTTWTLGMILYRYIIWRQHTEKSASYNQCVILLSNLLVADLIQSLSFSISFHWYRVDGVLAPTSYCYTQAGALQFGNMSSGSFVFAIALHTCYSIVKKRSIHPRLFTRGVGFIWFLSFCFTIGGPLAHGADFYARAGNWCWISEKYNIARLLIHYLWIFMFEFSTIVIYAGLFFYLRRGSGLASSHSSLATRNPQLLKAARYMIAYPVVYLVGTLPIATGRMMIMSGKRPSDRYLLFAGAMLTSCGWIDGLLYTITRNVFRDSDSERYRNESTSNSASRQNKSICSSDGDEASGNNSATNAPIRPRLAGWMRSVSSGSVRVPLVRMDSACGSQRLERFPSDVTAWELDPKKSRQTSAATLSFAEFLAGGPNSDIEYVAPPKKRPSDPNVSFAEFLNGHEFDAREVQHIDELCTIPESPVQHTAPR